MLLKKGEVVKHKGLAWLLTYFGHVQGVLEEGHLAPNTHGKHPGRGERS
ncbi:MAG TPA: hypothetical protein VGB26_03560 [Nitrospiria bacterium]|jgi:hypothetical protein